MASEEIDNITERYSVLQSISASNLEDSLDQNICQTQAMWVQIAHTKSRLEEEPTLQAEPDDQAAQLWQKDQQMAEIMEEEMTHQEQVSILSHMHLQQVKEVKAQSQGNEVNIGSGWTATEGHWKFNKSPKSSQGNKSSFNMLWNLVRCYEEEVFNMVLGTVNTRRGAAVSCNTIMTSVPVVDKNSFEDMLTEEVNFTASCQPKHCYILDTMGEGVTSSTCHKYQEEVVLPSRPTKNDHPKEIGFYVAAYKFRKMQESKISKLKGGYSSSAGLIFQSWLKDIHVHVEDRRLTQREAISLVKDFTAEHAWDEVEFIWAW